MMDFMPKMMDFVPKMMDFLLKMIPFLGSLDDDAASQPEGQASKHYSSVLEKTSTGSYIQPFAAQNPPCLGLFLG